MNKIPPAGEFEANAARYAGVPGHWDEAVLPSGYPRKHWRKLASAVGRMDAAQLTRHWQAGQQFIQAHGVTYNISSDSKGSERSWPMDPIPLVIPENEWAHIEHAIIQRATLLNAILADLYGPQRLLNERHLPAALVFANPHFIRPVCGISLPGNTYIHTYAADLGRSPDGRWWVIADRTQAPSGMGYALQNRLASARTLPGVFSQCRVRALTRFFDMKREALFALAANKRESPGIVVLTPGPLSETHSEHSFLAGQWGFPLVEGADLTVVDRRVYLKALSGLKPVDLILRRMDDAFCDPLELRGDSLLGVPGLVDAVRSGSVVIDNALGSGLVETAAHMAFLPGLSRGLLGEELRMPSVATWWCGQEAPRRYVQEHLENLVLKQTFPRFGRHPEFPESLDTNARGRLAARIEAHPEEFVAQERVALSTAPVRTEDGVRARHVMVRVYAAWNGQSYVVMPGGLTRVSSGDASLVVSMQLGGGSKDTWIPGHSEEPASSRRQLSLSNAVQPSQGDLPSRVADNLFWLGRYTERVEARVRFVRALLPALSGEEDFGRTASLETAVRLLAGLHYLPYETANASIGERWREVLRSLTEMVYDSSQTSSLRWNLKEMHRVSLHLKERLSSDTWRVLQELERAFSGFTPSDADQRYFAGLELLDNVIVTLSAFAGLLMENTTRGYGWRFLEIGRRMERALQTAQLLLAGLSAAPADDVEPYLRLQLEIADSSMTYRSRYPIVLQTDSVLQLLLADESNPRSVAFQLATLLHQIERLQEGPAGPRGVEYDLAQKALMAVRTSRMAELSERDQDGRPGALENLVDGLRMDMLELSDALTVRYLTHVTVSNLMASW